MKKILVAILLGSLSAGVSLSASAVTEAKSEKQAATAVQFRQALLQLVRSNVGALGAMARDRIPMDAATIEKNATRLEQLSMMMDDYFSVDTRKFDVETASLPVVWENYADFQSKIKDLESASSALKMAAQKGDSDAFKARIGAVLKTCKGCHDTYKAE